MDTYLFDTFQENITQLEKLQGLLENALMNFEYTVLTESENSLSAIEQKKNLKYYFNKAIEFLSNLWDKIIKILGEAVKRVVGNNIYYVMKTDVEIGKYTMDKFPDMICNRILNTSNNESDEVISQLEEKMDEYILQSLNDKYTLSEGSRVDVVAYLKNRKANSKYIKSLEKKSTDSDFDPRLAKLYKKLIKFLTIIGNDSSKVISNCKLFKKADTITITDKDGKRIARESRIISKYNKQSRRDYDKVHGIKNESVTLNNGDDYMTKNEYIASIMLEAADLLQEDEVLNEGGARHKFTKLQEKKIEEYKKDDNEDRARKFKENLVNYGTGASKGGYRGGNVYFYDKISGDNNEKDLELKNRSNQNINKAKMDEREFKGIGKSKFQAAVYGNGLGKRAKGTFTVRGEPYYRDSFDGTTANKKFKEFAKGKSPKNKELHDRINKRAALKEAIDLLYDKAANADTLDEATMYIDRAEQLESMIEE